MKKMVLSATILAGILALGGGGVFAAGQIARSNAITEENALNFAYVDAGVLPEDVETNRTEFDFENGKFVYELEFISDGVKYEYVLESATGKIIEKESERIFASVRGQDAATVKSAAPEQSAFPEQSVSTEQNPAPEQGVSTEQNPAPEQGSAPVQVGKPETAPEWSSPSEAMGVDKAKDVALKKAGLSGAGVIFEKAKLELDDGRLVYEIDFYSSDGKEYEYEIDAYSGEIVSEDVEVREYDD